MPHGQPKFWIPPAQSPDEDPEDLDDMVDGDRQLTTDSGALDGGLNDSDLGTYLDDGDAEAGQV